MRRNGKNFLVSGEHSGRNKWEGGHGLLNMVKKTVGITKRESERSFETGASPGDPKILKATGGKKHR